MPYRNFQPTAQDRPCWHRSNFEAVVYMGSAASCALPNGAPIGSTPERGCSASEREPGADDEPDAVPVCQSGFRRLPPRGWHRVEFAGDGDVHSHVYGVGHCSESPKAGFAMSLSLVPWTLTRTTSSVAGADSAEVEPLVADDVGMDTGSFNAWRTELGWASTVRRVEQAAAVPRHRTLAFMLIS